MKRIFVLLIIVGLFACKKDPKPGSLKLRMNHDVAGEAFAFNQQNYTSPVGHDYEITKLRYYISDVRFVTKDGTVFNQEGGHLIELEDASSFDYEIAQLEPGVYNKIQFQFGISKDLNVESYLENTQTNQNMAWPTQLGPGAYHYMQFEGKYDSLNTGAIKPFIFHAGPTNGNDNSFMVELAINEFEIDDNSYSLSINVDIHEWFKSPTVYDFKDYSMVMMNQTTQEIYQANGPSVFSLGQLIKNGE